MTTPAIVPTTSRDFDALAVQARLEAMRFDAKPETLPRMTETADRLRTLWLARRWQGHADSLRLKDEILACRRPDELMRVYSGWVDSEEA